MSEKSRKPSELGGGGSSSGPRQSDVAAEKSSISEVASDEQPQDVAPEVQYAVTIDSGGVQVDNEVPALKPRQPPPKRHSAEIRAPASEAYARDRGTVRALALTHLAASDRSTVDAWLDKLDRCDDPVVRSQYAEFLLRTVVGGSIRVEPFCGRPPPGGPLRQLGQRVADPVLLHQHSSPTTTQLQPTLRRVTPTTRQSFYGRQPVPEDGTICYAAAFSEMF